MITIVTKGYCPYCKAARDLLDSLDVEYTNHDVTENEVLYSQVKEITGSHTVPQVFV
jgi:glutaredoxin 3